MAIREEKLFLVCLPLMIFLSEIMVFYRPFIGVFFSAFTLTFLLIPAVFSKKLRNLLSCLSIIPTARLIEFSISSHDVFLRTVFVYYLIFILSFGYHICLRIKKTGHNLKHISDLPLIILIGILLGFLEYSFLPKKGLNLGISFSLVFLFFLFFGYTEEFLFRGLIQNSIKKMGSVLYSILFTSFLYAFVHIASGFSGVIFAFLISTITSLVYYQKKNIFLTTILNTTINLTFFLLVFS